MRSVILSFNTNVVDSQEEAELAKAKTSPAFVFLHPVWDHIMEVKRLNERAVLVE